MRNRRLEPNSQQAIACYEEGCNYIHTDPERALAYIQKAAQIGHRKAAIMYKKLMFSIYGKSDMNLAEYERNLHNKPVCPEKIKIKSSFRIPSENNLTCLSSSPKKPAQPSRSNVRKIKSEEEKKAELEHLVERGKNGDKEALIKLGKRYVRTYERRKQKAAHQSSAIVPAPHRESLIYICDYHMAELNLCSSGCHIYPPTINSEDYSNFQLPEPTELARNEWLYYWSCELFPDIYMLLHSDSCSESHCDYLSYSFGSKENPCRENDLLQRIHRFIIKLLW